MRTGERFFTWKRIAELAKVLLEESDALVEPILNAVGSS
nr:hypothetical protein CDS [Bradyrhizobium sp.]CUT16821.1 hypothetical protein CDS [Bradyrhizobium sp.]